jgi:hypothetical protein
MTVGPWSRCWMACGGAVLLSVSPTVRPSIAQVGHEPGHSPYRDMLRGGVMLVTGGYFGGSRGHLGVGMSNGPTGGLRYETALGGAIGVSLGLAYAQTSRVVVNPYQDTLSRRSGPYDNDVVIADAGLQLVLTGQKTWRGLAPYLGAALGLAVGGGSPPDTSGYDFGTKLAIMPEAGIRWYPARRVSVRADFRAVGWKLTYPVSYKVPYNEAPVLGPTASLTEWTWHPWFTLGLGWTF